MLHLSDTFVLSAGTVAIDLSKDLVLVLYSPRISKYFLPKGRKDIHESLHDAAIRETLEESGYHVQLLAHNLPTNATHANSWPEAEPNPNTAKAETPPGPHDGTSRLPPRSSAPPPGPAPAGVLSDRNNNSPVRSDQRAPAALPLETGGQQQPSSADQRHVEPIAVQQRTYENSYKIIFWYLAEVDSEQMPVEGAREAWEDYEVRWMGAEEAVGKMSREEDGRIIEWALKGAGGVRAERNIVSGAGGNPFSASVSSFRLIPGGILIPAPFPIAPNLLTPTSTTSTLALAKAIAGTIHTPQLHRIPGQANFPIFAPQVVLGQTRRPARGGSSGIPWEPWSSDDGKREARIQFYVPVRE
ncbi:conserved hypothetical protein [Uncinocarpus reesii 1704]|uniref:Nudix hydrolase domain-containing protein n=1 Tax=Uncinocarpus reesii (strain UAMH 1704) TaxID=336963 RepID=C4JSZ7_UNCRE|nr:uncharacterized protein UREG_05586 [Uncinocarpus reesii 1704]EEP80744.1 conserved hypothetical protein [Uncinocarpus reesii 1704]